MKSAKKKPTSTAPKKVLLVDDHPIMRQGLALLISSDPGFVICGEAETAAQALEAARTTKPDIVLTDITLPGKNGIELIKDLLAMYPGLPVLVLSMHDESMYAERVLRAGGRGYVMKQEGGQKLLDAIRRVLAGGIFVSDRMSANILEIFSGHRDESSGSPVSRLSDREFEVFQLIGQGRSTKEIAASLNLSAKTVEVHRLNIKQKLDIHTAGELIHYASRWTEAERNKA